MTRARNLADQHKTLDVDGGTIKLDGNYPVGTNNVALGDTALDSLTSGASNTAIGHQALHANTTGVSNTALGVDALDACTTGQNNTAVGRLAGSGNITSNENTSVGYYTNPLGTGSKNITMGVGAGSSGSFTGSTNVFLGYQAGGAVTTGDANVIVGGFSGDASNFDLRTIDNNVVISDGNGGIHFASANGAAFITPMGDYTRHNHMIGKLAIANTADGTVDLVKVSEAGANNNVYFRVTIMATAAIGRRGTYYEGYAGIDANGGAQAAVTAVVESGIPSGWSDAGNFTLSWNTASSPYTLRLTCNRGENYTAASINVSHVQHDSYANIAYQSQFQAYA